MTSGGEAATAEPAGSAWHHVKIAFLLTVILTFVFDGLEAAGIYRATRSALVTANLVIWVGALVFLNWRYR